VATDSAQSPRIVISAKRFRMRRWGVILTHPSKSLFRIIKIAPNKNASACIGKQWQLVESAVTTLARVSVDAYIVSCIVILTSSACCR
jgi:hypothetical protein